MGSKAPAGQPRGRRKPASSFDEETLSSKQVCVRTRVSYRQLDYWDRIGLITPSLKGARGSGSRRVYNSSDAELAEGIRQLLDAGVELGTIRRIVAGERHRLNELTKAIADFRRVVLPRLMGR